MPRRPSCGASGLFQNNFFYDYLAKENFRFLSSDGPSGLFVKQVEPPEKQSGRQIFQNYWEKSVSRRPEIRRNPQKKRETTFLRLSPAIAKAKIQRKSAKSKFPLRILNKSAAAASHIADIGTGRSAILGGSTAGSRHCAGPWSTVRARRAGPMPAAAWASASAVQAFSPAHICVPPPGGKYIHQTICRS